MDQACSVDATQDLVGIGIRTGLYCQWIASFIASIAVPAELSSLQTTILCFQCAILGALILVTVRGTLLAQEVLVVLWLSFGGFLAAHVFAGTSGANMISLWRFVFMVQVFGTLLGYSTWFWARGVLALESDTCHYATFVFARVEIIRLRWFAVALTAICGLIILAAEGFLLFHFARVFAWNRPAAAFRLLLQAEIPLDNPLADMPKWRYWVMNALRIISMIYVVVTVELTIIWSRIDNAYNLDEVGQLIPLTVGVTGMIKVLYYWAKDWERSHPTF